MWSKYVIENSAVAPKKTTRQQWLTGVLMMGCVMTAYVLLSRLDLVMPLAQIPAVLCLPHCSDPLPKHPRTAESQHLNSSKPLAALLEDKILEEKISGEKTVDEKIDLQKVSLLIKKSQHRVTVFYDLEPIKSYESVFGTDPVGDKRIEGDRKTPEGIFRIRDLYPHDEWSKFIWLDYPTPSSWQKHFQSKAAGEIGLLSTIGGQIGIHGVPADADGLVDTRSNWTWGCISLKNQDVDEIYKFVTRGTVVEIVP